MPEWIVVMGASLGGLQALKTVLGGLGSDFAAPVAVAQHRAKFPPELLSTVLQTHTALKVKEAEDRDILESGCVYLAPADYHLLIDDRRCALSLEAPVKHSRPSIDVLFESAAEAYQNRAIAVVLTGNNADGASGARRIKQMGGLVVIQNPAECEASVMPLAAMAAVGTTDGILKLDEIASFLGKHLTCD